jgi:hypothetical protein
MDSYSCGLLISTLLSCSLDELVDARRGDCQKRRRLAYREPAVGDETVRQVAGVLGEPALGRVELGSQAAQALGRDVDVVVAGVVRRTTSRAVNVLPMSVGR